MISDYSRITFFKTSLKMYHHELLVFLIAFGYILFVTAGVPLFWEEQIYQEWYVQEPMLTHIKEIFLGFGHNNIFASGRPFDAILFKVLFSITDYNYTAMRFAKALLFGFFIVLIFSFVKQFMKNKIAAYCSSFFIMCTLSLYIHTLVFAEPYLLTEVLKLIIFFFFFSDYFAEKTSPLKQLFIGFLFLLSIRTYQPAYSTMGILMLFVLLHNLRSLKRYACLFVFFIISALPWPLTLQIGGGLSPKLWSIQHFFLNDISHYISTPIISLQGLYYKPFFALLTFFGVWLMFIFLLLFLFQPLFRKFSLGMFIASENDPELREKKENIDAKMITLFLFVWLAAELPLWIILPEHATRYANSILLPFSILITLMILHVFSFIRHEHKKICASFVILFIVLAILSNLAYVFAFRGGWGSSFIAIEKSQDFIAEQKEGKAVALYFGQSVAEEYYPINKSNKQHELIDTLVFKQLKETSDFSKEAILSYGANYNEVYILKRITSGYTELPSIPFEDYSFLKEIQTIEGTKKYDPFDAFIQFLTKMHVLSYAPNYVLVYKVVSETPPY